MFYRLLTIADTSDVNGGSSFRIIPDEGLAIITASYERIYGIGIRCQEALQMKQPVAGKYVHSS